MRVFKIEFKNCGYTNKLKFENWNSVIFFTKHGNILLPFKVKHKKDIIKNIRNFFNNQFPKLNINFENIEIIELTPEYKHQNIIEYITSRISNFFKLRKFKEILEKDKSLFVMDLYTNDVYQSISEEELCSDFKILKIGFEKVKI